MFISTLSIPLSTPRLFFEKECINDVVELSPVLAPTQVSEKYCNRMVKSIRSKDMKGSMIIVEYCGEERFSACGHALSGTQQKMCFSVDVTHTISCSIIRPTKYTVYQSRYRMVCGLLKSTSLSRTSIASMHFFWTRLDSIILRLCALKNCCNNF